MFKQLLAILLCIALLSCTACAARMTENPLPTSDREETTTLPPEDDSQTGETSETVGTTAPDPDPEPTLPEPVLPEKRTFDKEAVYRHVFEEHIERLDESEAETIDLDIEKKQTLLQIAFMPNGGDGYDEYYLLEGFTTAVSGHRSEYEVFLNNMYPNLSAGAGRVYHDYHEAYLDVLFESMTFSPCEGLPDRSEFFDFGSIYVGDETYMLWSDGYFYQRGESLGDGTYAYVKSDQKVDFAYLAGIIMIACLCEPNKAELGDRLGEQNRYHRNYMNVGLPIEGAYTVRSFIRDGSAYTYYIDDQGDAYTVWNDGRIRWYTMQGVVLIHGQYTHCVLDAEANGFFD